MTVDYFPYVYILLSAPWSHHSDKEGNQMPRKEEENLTGFPLSPEQKGQCSGWRRLPGGRGLPKEDGKKKAARQSKAEPGVGEGTCSLPLSFSGPSKPPSPLRAAVTRGGGTWRISALGPGLCSLQVTEEKAEIQGFEASFAKVSILQCSAFHSPTLTSNHLILCCPLLLLPSIFPSIRIFSSELALRIRWSPS